MGAREPSASTTAAPRSFRCEVCGRLHAEGVDGGQRCQSIGERVTAPSPPPSYELLFGPPAEGHVLAGRYHLHRRLGRGAYAVVHAATDLQLGREVAVKLGPDPDAAAIAHRRFLREAQMMAEVGGPGTVIVYDYGVLATTGHPFIVMERLRGETLRVRMERQRPMALDEARDIAGEVLLTLSAFHARGVIHRDLKPEN
ncbi:MAG: serine/threonine protein kinase, partial [Myxococcales bacterium]|nr:serine/threonine protein kinase [Myxococcales bacterium]